MTHQEKLMKDWSPKRKCEALSIVASNFHLFMEYDVEHLMTLAQNNRDAFDLFASVMMDKADEMIEKE